MGILIHNWYDTLGPLIVASHPFFPIPDANTDFLFRGFEDAESESRALLEKGLVTPAYDYCIKASHLFNLLDSRGKISVTERASYIARIRDLARACSENWSNPQSNVSLK